MPDQQTALTIETTQNLQDIAEFAFVLHILVPPPQFGPPGWLKTQVLPGPGCSGSEVVLILILAPNPDLPRREHRKGAYQGWMPWSHFGHQQGAQVTGLKLSFASKFPPSSV
jgi:hypothetical protein